MSENARRVALPSRSVSRLPASKRVRDAVNLWTCQIYTASPKRRKTFTVLQLVNLLSNYTQSVTPNYTLSLFYKTKGCFSSTKLHAITLLPNYTLSLFYQTTRCHSSTTLHAVTLLPNYTQSLFYQITRSHTSYVPPSFRSAM
jgi:hypothetical protein